jgi:photosystem II stability/assembly factor-like uncharacterized protein
MKTFKTIIISLFLLAPGILLSQCQSLLGDNIPDGFATFSFISQDTGWRFVSNGNIYKTTDGQETWQLMNDLFLGVDYGKIKFVSQDTGFVYTGDTFYWTTDGGINWNQNQNGFNNDLFWLRNQSLIGSNRNVISYSNDFRNSIQTDTFPSNIHGFSISESGKGYFYLKSGAIHHFEDGNPEKDPRFTHTGNSIISLYFFNDDEGLFVDDSLFVFQTIDAGYTWTKISQINPDGDNETDYYLEFLSDQLTGSLSSRNSQYLYKTFDGGLTWLLESSRNQSIEKVEVCNDGAVWFHTPQGITFRSVNEFSLENLVQSQITQAISELEFFSDSNWLINGYKLMFSDDAGATFQLDEDNISYNVYSLEVVSPTDAYMVDYDGKFYKSTDRGKNWELINDLSTSYIDYMNFFSEDTGYIFEPNKLFLKTTDGGNTWENVNQAGLPNELSRLHQFDENLFTVLGNDSIFITQDGAQSWQGYPFFNSSVLRVQARKSNDIITFPVRNDGIYELQISTGTYTKVMDFTDGINFLLWSDNTLFFATEEDLYYSINGTEKPVDLYNPKKGLVKIINLQKGPNDVIYVSGFDGYLAKIGNESPECDIQFQNYQQDSIYRPGSRLIWSNPSPCYRNYIVSIGTTPGGRELIADTLLGEFNYYNFYEKYEFYKNLYINVGLVGPYDTVYCIKKHLTQPVCDIEIPILRRICGIDSIQFLGNYYPRGNHEIRIETPGACDTVYQLNVERIFPQRPMEFVSICSGESYSWHQKIYSETGEYFDTIPSYLGCDSLIDGLTLVVNEPSNFIWETYPETFYKNRNELFFINDSLGWSTENSRDKLFRTLDKGKTWHRIYFTPLDRVHEIYFLNESKGWILLENNIVGITEDGGYSWDFYPTGFSDKVNGIAFANESIGYVWGEKGKVSKSTDGGKSWIYLNTPETETLTGAWLFNENEVYFYGHNGTMIYSGNGGTTWSSRFSFGNTILDLVFIDRDTGYISVNPALLKTTDGGINWEAIPGNFSTGPGNLAIINNKELFRFEGGDLTLSKDFGLSRELVYLEDRNYITSFFTDNDSNIWIARSGGDIQHYHFKELQCISTLSQPDSNQTYISTLQEFTWEGIQPCPQGYAINLGTGNQITNLVDNQDIGIQTAFQNSTPLPFDKEIQLTINPYLDGNSNQSCPSLTFRTCPFIGDSIKVEICEGEVFEFRGNQYTEDTKTYWSWSLPGGCDSFIVLDLKVLPVEQIVVDTTFDKGETFLGITLHNDTTIYRIYNSSSGCDSFVVYNIMVDRSSITNPDSFTGIRVYPNPTSGKLLVSIAEVPKGIVKSEMYNSTGQLVHRDNFFRRPNDLFELEIPPSVADGIYILKILFENGSYVEKISLKRP